MKSRLSVTIEENYLKAIERISAQENRSLSNQFERIVADWLRDRPMHEQLLITPGKFVGKFSREETYECD